MRYIAHSANQKGEEHELKKHLSCVADIMVKRVYNPEFTNLFRITGLLHDFGKYQPAFQKYLRNLAFKIVIHTQ